MKKAELKISSDKMMVFEKSNIYMFDFSDIIGIFCDHPYLLIETVNKTSKLIYHSLKEIAQLLPFPFIACNRSSIINVFYITQIINENPKSFVQLKNEKKLFIPRRKKNDIIKKINCMLKASFTI